MFFAVFEAGKEAFGELRFLCFVLVFEAGGRGHLCFFRCCPQKCSSGEWHHMIVVAAPFVAGKAVFLALRFLLLVLPFEGNGRGLWFESKPAFLTGAAVSSGLRFLPLSLFSEGCGRWLF